MPSNRELRGFDIGRLRTALLGLRLQTLRDVCSALEQGASGGKDVLVGRLVDAVVSGDVAVTEVFGSAPKKDLRRACRWLEFDDTGTIPDLVARLDRLVRYPPMGDATSIEDSFAPQLHPDLNDRERLFILELVARLRIRAKGMTQLTLGELIGRFGRGHAEWRARASAARELGDVLHAHGIITVPDLRSVERSPGIDSLVELRLNRELHGPVANQELDRQGGDAVDEQGQVLEEVARLGMVVSKSDQQVVESELARIRENLLATTVAHSPEARHRLIAVVEKLREEDIDAETVAHRLVTNLDQAARTSLLVHLFDVALADGVVVPEEEAALRWLNEVLQPDPGVFSALITSYQSSVSDTELGSVLPEVPVHPSANELASAAGSSSKHIDEILEILFD